MNAWNSLETVSEAFSLRLVKALMRELNQPLPWRWRAMEAPEVSFEQRSLQKRELRGTWCRVTSCQDFGVSLTADSVVLGPYAGLPRDMYVAFPYILHAEK